MFPEKVLDIFEAIVLDEIGCVLAVIVDGHDITAQLTREQELARVEVAAFGSVV